MIKDFHKASWDDEVIKKIGKVDELSGVEVGTKRVLNDAFHETLYVDRITLFM